MLNDQFPGVLSGDILSVEHDWVRTFAFLPHRTINKQWVWFKFVYCRRVWMYTGFVDEPVTQYANLFDILQDA
jgi:hypothetical protein